MKRCRFVGFVFTWLNQGHGQLSAWRPCCRVAPLAKIVTVYTKKWMLYLWPLLVSGRNRSVNTAHGSPPEETESTRVRMMRRLGWCWASPASVASMVTLQLCGNSTFLGNSDSFTICNEDSELETVSSGCLCWSNTVQLFWYFENVRYIRKVAFFHSKNNWSLRSF